MKFEIDEKLAKAIIENANFVYCELHNFAQDLYEDEESIEDAETLQEYADNLIMLAEMLEEQLEAEGNDKS